MNPNKKLESPDAAIAANAASEREAIASTIFCLVVLAVGLPQLVVTYREMTTTHFVIQIAAMIFVIGVVA